MLLVRNTISGAQNEHVGERSSEPALLIAILIVSAIGGPSAGATDVAWTSKLPIVKGTKTEVGPVKFLVGSLLVFLAPRKFGDYWPDYGYSWAKARNTRACEMLEMNGRWANTKVGRVRVVATKGDDEEGLIGLELRPRKNDEAQGTHETQGNDDVAELTVEQLCDLLRDEEATGAIESAMAAIANWGKDLPTTVEWQAMPVDKVKVYSLMWKGSVVDTKPMAMAHTAWKLPHDRYIAWEAAEPMIVAGGYGTKTSVKLGFKSMTDEADTDKVHYFLNWLPDNPSDRWGGLEKFAVKEGIVTDQTFTYPSLSKGIFEMWTLLDEPGMSLAQDIYSRMWLVTEYKLPLPSFESEIRMDAK